MEPGAGLWQARAAARSEPATVLAATKETLSLALALHLCGSGVAHAVTLRTVFVHVSADQRIRVRVTNLGTKPIDDLTVTLTDDDGNTETPSIDFRAEGGSLLPRHSCEVLYVFNHAGFATVTGKGKLSASVQVTGPDTALVTVVPATK